MRAVTAAACCKRTGRDDRCTPEGRNMFVRCKGPAMTGALTLVRQDTECQEICPFRVRGPNSPRPRFPPPALLRPLSSAPLQPITQRHLRAFARARARAAPSIAATAAAAAPECATRRGGGQPACPAAPSTASGACRRGLEARPPAQHAPTSALAHIDTCGARTAEAVHGHLRDPQQRHQEQQRVRALPIAPHSIPHVILSVSFLYCPLPFCPITSLPPCLYLFNSISSLYCLRRHLRLHLDSRSLRHSYCAGRYPCFFM